MGIPQLKKILNGRHLQGIKTIHIRELCGQCVAFDLSSVIYKIKQRCIDNKSTNPDDLLRELFNILHKFTYQGIRIIGVFDGKPSQKKDKVINSRKKHRETAKKKLDSLDISFDDENIKYSELSTISDESEFNVEMIDELFENAEAIQKRINLTKRSTGIKYNDVQRCKLLLNQLHIPYIHKLNTEADIVLRYLNNYKLATYFYTNDTDALAMGCNMLTDLNYSTDYIKYYDYNMIISELKLTPIQMTELCICLGSDYNQGITNISSSRLIELYQKYGCLHEIVINKEIELYDFPTVFNYDDAFEFFTGDISVEICNDFTNFEFIKPTNELINTHYSTIITCMNTIYTTIISTIIDLNKKLKFKRKLSEFYSSRYGIAINIM